MAQTREYLSIAVPVLLVDEQMPQLKDTELRVLLVVLRQTCVQGKETGVAWLTHRELCRRTGRASEAVSAAVDVLVRQGMLRVLDEAGKALATALERRARTGRRFYKVLYVQGAQENAGVVAKAKTIEENNNNYSFRKTEVPLPTLVETLTPEKKQLVEQEKAKIREHLQRL